MFGSFEKERTKKTTTRQQLKVSIISIMNRFARSSGQPSQPQFSNIATPLSQTRWRARAFRVNIAGLHSNVDLQHAATALEGSLAECLKNCDILRYDSTDYTLGENSKLAEEPRVRLEHQYCSSLHSERLMANDVGGSPELPSRREASFETFTLGEGSAENEIHLGALKAHAPVVLPPFWDVDANLWFVTAENIFRLHNIRLERDRYELTLGSLDLRHLQKVRHVIQDLNGKFSYFQLKEAFPISKSKWGPVGLNKGNFLGPMCGYPGGARKNMTVGKRQVPCGQPIFNVGCPHDP